MPDIDTLKASIHPDALQQMQAHGGTWFAYRNEALDHSQCGHLKFLRCGPGCTHETPPQILPDGPDGAINWPYQLVTKEPVVGTPQLGARITSPKLVPGTAIPLPRHPPIDPEELRKMREDGSVFFAYYSTEPGAGFHFLRYSPERTREQIGSTLPTQLPVEVGDSWVTHYLVSVDPVAGHPAPNKDDK